MLRRDMIARSLKKLFRTVGYELRPLQTAVWHSDSDALRKPGFEPATVIDVGVGFGTPDLYEAFPKAHFVLLEPLEEFVPSLESWTSRYSAEYHLTAVGSREERRTIYVNPRRIQRSTLERRTELTMLTREEEPREIQVTPLDTLLARHGWKPPFGLKIDAEGYECEVLEGAERLLAQTQFIVAEVSVAERFEGSYSFADFVALADARGFRLCDILRGPRKDGELVFVDAVFRAKDPRPVP